MDAELGRVGDSGPVVDHELQVAQAQVPAEETPAAEPVPAPAPVKKVKKVVKKKAAAP